MFVNIKNNCFFAVQKKICNFAFVFCDVKSC